MSQIYKNNTKKRLYGNSGPNLHIQIWLNLFLDYINAFYEIFDNQNMGLDVISIHVFLSLNDILQEHFFRTMAD